MSIFQDVKDLAGGSSQSKDWYRSQMFYGLQDYTGGFLSGDIIFFNYGAATSPDKLPWYDQYPMVQIYDRDMQNLQFQGGNLHYLRPEMRRAVGKSWALGGRQYPLQCHHKYFMSNATNIKVVPREEFTDIIPLPLEQFVMSVVGRWMEVPSSHIWSRT